MVNERKIKLAGFLLNSFDSCVTTFGSNQKTLTYFSAQLERLENLGQITQKEQNAFMQFVKAGNMLSIRNMQLILQPMLLWPTQYTDAATIMLLQNNIAKGLLSDCVLQFFCDFFDIPKNAVTADKSTVEKPVTNNKQEMLNPVGIFEKPMDKVETKKPVNKAVLPADKTPISYNTFLESDYVVMAKLSEDKLRYCCSGDTTTKYKEAHEFKNNYGLAKDWEYAGLYRKKANPSYDGCSGSRRYIYEEADVTLNTTAIKWIMRWKYPDARKPRIFSEEKPKPKSTSVSYYTNNSNRYYDPCRDGSGGSGPGGREC